MKPELRTIVIDGTLPVLEITKQVLAAQLNGCGVAIRFDDSQDNEVAKGEINAMLQQIDWSLLRPVGETIHDDPAFPNDALWIMPDTDERRYLTLNPALTKGNRQARRAELAQQRREMRRGKW